MSEEDRLLELEVSELTEMLREDPILDDLRTALSTVGLSSDACLLAGFMESEDGDEWGLIVGPSGEPFEYHRRTLDGSSSFQTWQRCESQEKALRDWPAVKVVGNIDWAKP